MGFLGHHSLGDGRLVGHDDHGDTRSVGRGDGLRHPREHGVAAWLVEIWVIRIDHAITVKEQRGSRRRCATSLDRPT